MIKIELISSKTYAKKIRDIHELSFKGFFLTFLGKGFLKTFYEGLIKSEFSNIYGAYYENELVGFLGYTINSSSFYKYLIKTKLLKFFYYSMIAFIKKPKIIFRLIRALKYPNKKKKNDNCLELLSIGVMPTYSGKGLGNALMKKFIDDFSNSKFDCILLDTDSDNNDQVNSFYKKQGFELDCIYLTKEGRRMNQYKFYINKDKELI